MEEGRYIGGRGELLLGWRVDKMEEGRYTGGRGSFARLEGR